uniref:SKICH domain-containing protein n=1 Tax=Macrostomum lignano TaxID=282301 RepID=A0A1I8HEV8_9PLAT
MEAQPKPKQPPVSGEEDIEKLSLVDIEAAMSMSVTDAVFTSVLSSYPVGAHIQCRCQVSDPADLSEGCWVGLFKVGWASAEADCVCRAECRRESERVLAAVFSPGQLPRDTREFYQFCFAAPGGLVKGASPPFLFRAAPADDFVSVVDEELQGVVVSARTAQLEGQLASMRLEQEAQRSAAEDAAERLRAELSELSERLSAAESRAANSKSESCRLRAELGRQDEWRQVQAARLIEAEDEKQRLLRRLEEVARDAETAGDQADAARQSLELHAAERQRLAEELQAARLESERLSGQLQAVSGQLEAAQQRERRVADQLTEAQQARYCSLLTAYEGVKKQFHSAEDRERIVKLKYDEVIECNRQMLAREDRLHQTTQEFKDRLQEGCKEYKRLMKKYKEAQHQLQRQQQAEPAEEFHDAIGGDDETEEDGTGTVIHRPPPVEVPLTALTAAAPVAELARVCPVCDVTDFASQTDYEEHVHSHFGEADD